MMKCPKKLFLPLIEPCDMAWRRDFCFCIASSRQRPYHVAGSASLTAHYSYNAAYKSGFNAERNISKLHCKNRASTFPKQQEQPLKSDAQKECTDKPMRMSSRSNWRESTASMYG